ncbi:hypothetical protein BG015_010586 [Linnemannia schmuckeri]|uniref:Uncharacterized protein n=1 Tax=Linnemannia schmuckeri TaxID=64567 RepID=A0A9P5RUA6_9FUNG|nr:hypothetical protein BG015_010586 [Linnemannia schmuckeri]
MVALSAFEVALVVFSVLACLLIISIWVRQAKERRQHFSLSFMFIWLLLVALLTFLSQFLLEPSSFDLSLPEISGLQTFNSAYLIDPTHGPVSGLTAVSTIAITPKNVSQLQTCVLFAHFEEVLWLGVGISLLRWTWYLYSSLRRKLGVVSPRLIEAVAEHDSAAVRGSTRAYGGSGGGVESNMAAGFSFTRRSIRSLSDVWGMMPVFIVVPVAIMGLVIKTCIRSVFCCYCLARNSNDKTPISDQNRAVMEEEIQRKMKAKNVGDVFEAWPKWPKYMDDDPLANQNQVAAEPSDQFTQLHVQSPLPDVGSLSSQSTTTSLVSEHPTLAAKLRVTRLDLNDTHEESYGYDITKQRIRYHRDSWSHKTRVMMVVHRRLIGDICVCIVIPALAFIPLYVIPAQDRAYNIYRNRGGCRVSDNGSQADWVRMVVLLTLNTFIAVFGLLFAILSILQFKKQNGALSFKMKSLTPSPAVLRLYKATEIVKNILLFCVGLNTILALGRIIYLGQAISAYKQLTVNGTNLDPQPLFRAAKHDPDVSLVFLAIVLVVVTYLTTFWTGLRNWRCLLCCFRYASSENEDGSAHANSASLHNYPKPLNSISKGVHQHQQRPVTPNRCLAQLTSTTTTSVSRTSVEPRDSDMTRLEKYPESRVGIVEPSMIISIGSERRVTDLNEELEGDSTRAESCRITIELPSTITKPEQAAHPEERFPDSSSITTTTTTTWLSSAPINADGALTAIPSTSTFTSSTLSSTASTLVSYPLPVASLIPKLSKSTLHNLSSPKLLAYTQGPLPTIPGQHTSATRTKGQSHSIVSASSPRCTFPAFSQAQTMCSGEEATGTRDNQKVSLTAVGRTRDPAQTTGSILSSTASTTTSTCSSDSQQTYPSIGLRILQNQGSYPNSVTTHASPSSHAFLLSLSDKDASPVAGTGDCDPTATAVTAFMNFDYDYDCELDSDLDDHSDPDLDLDYEDNYDMETMGAISLEELVFDEPSTDYDSIYQTMMIPSDNRVMLENIVQHALMSSTPPSVSSHHRTTTTAAMQSCSSSSSRRSTSRGRNGGRRPSVIQYSNSSYGHGHISRASSGRSSRRSEDIRHPYYQHYSHPPLPVGAYFHLVSKGINVVDLYGDADDDETTEGGPEFTAAAAAARPRIYHHRKKSSTSSLYNVPFQPHPHPYRLRGFGGKGKSPVGGVGTSTIFENEPSRPDSPTDPRDL